MAEHKPERQALPGRGELVAALASETQGSSWVSASELEPAAEWRDRRRPEPRSAGVIGRLRTLLAGREVR